MARSKVLPLDTKSLSVQLTSSERDYLRQVAQRTRVTSFGAAIRQLIRQDAERCERRERRAQKEAA